MSRMSTMKFNIRPYAAVDLPSPLTLWKSISDRSTYRPNRFNVALVGLMSINILPITLSVCLFVTLYQSRLSRFDTSVTNPPSRVCRSFPGDGSHSLTVSRVLGSNEGWKRKMPAFPLQWLGSRSDLGCVFHFSIPLYKEKSGR